MMLGCHKTFCVRRTNCAHQEGKSNSCTQTVNNVPKYNNYFKIRQGKKTL